MARVWATVERMSGWTNGSVEMADGWEGGRIAWERGLCPSVLGLGRSRISRRRSWWYVVHETTFSNPGAWENGDNNDAEDSDDDVEDEEVE